MDKGLNQTFLPGVLNAADIIREHFSRIGKMGAASTSEKLRAARSRNLKNARSIRMEKLQRERSRNG